jgi:RimJ/RimL family protein N-acetyltransferase
MNGSTDVVFDTDRLILRRLDEGDADFIFELVNDPDWLRYIGDKGVKTLEDARNYIRTGPMAMYERVGFGLYLVQTKESGTPIGICGLLKRDTLDDVDIGFAFLPAFRAQGYAREAAGATLAYARDVLHLPRVIAITSPDNRDSARLLEKIGLRFESMQRHGSETHDVRVFGIDLDAGATSPT